MVSGPFTAPPTHNALLTGSRNEKAAPSSRGGFHFDRIVELLSHLRDVLGSWALLAFDHVELNLLAFA